MRRTVFATVALCSAAAFALACSPTTSPLDLAGTYALATVDGLPLPYLLPQAGATRVEVLDDQYTLHPAGTYAEVGHKTFTTGGVVTLVVPIDAGSFTRRGDVITMESLLYGSFGGTISGGTLTLVQQGLTLVYRK